MRVCVSVFVDVTAAILVLICCCIVCIEANYVDSFYISAKLLSFVLMRFVIVCFQLLHSDDSVAELCLHV